MPVPDRGSVSRKRRYKITKEANLRLFIELTTFYYTHIPEISIMTVQTVKELQAKANFPRNVLGLL